MVLIGGSSGITVGLDVGDHCPVSSSPKMIHFSLLSLVSVSVSVSVQEPQRRSVRCRFNIWVHRLSPWAQHCFSIWAFIEVSPRRAC